MSPNVQLLNDMNESAARDALTRCCGSARWVAGMLGLRPFANWDALVTAANHVWNALDKEDWLMAFSHHPRIGDSKLKAASANTTAWAEGEQAGVTTADARIKEDLLRLNHTYEAKFGFIYLVCATGKSGAELLAILRARMNNEAQDEILVAKEEQAKITCLRLEKLLA